MVFKPFRPPLIRKPPQQSSSSSNETASREPITITDDQDAPAPPAKKPRLQRDSLPRKLLLQVKNQGAVAGGEDEEKEKDKNGLEDGSGGERFFNVLWYGFPLTS